MLQNQSRNSKIIRFNSLWPRDNYESKLIVKIGLGDY